MRIYLAAPFFTEPQLQIVRKLEALLRDTAHQWYSPRSEGTLVNMSEEERAAQKQRIFLSNVARLDWCEAILAVVDGRDSGTTWELGYAYAKDRRIFTYTEEGFGLNVMIQQSVDAHLKGIEQASKFLFGLEGIGSNDSRLIDELAAKYRDFNPGIT